MSYVHTYTGKKFSLLNPRVADVDIDDIAWSLSQQCRFNGNCIGHYSVAQHCVHMSYAVPDQYALEALLHDATETYVGDMVKPLKDILPEFEKIEGTIWKVIAQKFGLPQGGLSKEIKIADEIMAATEIRDIMTHVGLVYYDAEFTDKALKGVTLFCTPAETARRDFLTRYRELA